LPCIPVRSQVEGVWAEGFTLLDLDGASYGSLLIDFISFGTTKENLILLLPDGITANIVLIL